jgi:hypothetical protein
MEMSEADVVFIGGARWQWRRQSSYRWLAANASWPFVELRLSNGSAHVQLRWAFPRRLAEHACPPLDFELSEATVDPMSPAGVRITSQDTGVIFWTFSPSDVLDALLARGSRLGEPGELPL